jgi:hypothetical protein
MRRSGRPPVDQRRRRPRGDQHHPDLHRLTLVNGWVNYGFDTAKASAASINGIVHLKGEIKTTGFNRTAFTLPPGFRPAHVVNVKVDLCGTHNGALYVTTDGEAAVQAFGANWANAQCFTSLDGVSFAR